MAAAVPESRPTHTRGCRSRRQLATSAAVFLLRHAEGREARATLVKLDELVAAIDGAREDVISIEKQDLRQQERVEERPTVS